MTVKNFHKIENMKLLKPNSLFHPKEIISGTRISLKWNIQIRCR